MNDSAAATWIRFRRLIPIDVGVNVNARAAQAAVQELHAAGWTADDLAAVVLFGINDPGIRNPGAIIVSRLGELVVSKQQPPRAPDVTPVPPDYDPLSHRGPGTPRASEWAAKARQQIRSTP